MPDTWKAWAAKLTGEAGDYRLSSWLFLRLVGLVYLVAFVSLWVQTAGLLGPRGIAPAAELLGQLAGRMGPERFWWLPTVFWFGAGDGALHLACAVGALAAVLVLLDRLAAPALAVAWLLYLSLVGVGQDFLSFQWDALLLEAGFLAIFLAPVALTLRARRPAARLPGAAARRSPLPAVAPLPVDVLVGGGQVAQRRSDLAELDRPHLPLRDPAAPQPARLLPVPAAGLVPSRRDGGDAGHRAGRAAAPLRPPQAEAPRRGRPRRAPDPHPRQRQLRLLQPAQSGALRAGARRRRLAGAAPRAAARRPVRPARADRPARPGHRRHGTGRAGSSCRWRQ